jgi:hypothetical protein
MGLDSSMIGFQVSSGATGVAYAGCGRSGDHTIVAFPMSLYVNLISYAGLLLERAARVRSSRVCYRRGGGATARFAVTRTAG